MTVCIQISPDFQPWNEDWVEKSPPQTKVKAKPVELEGKAKIINRAVQDIGMGRYQWGLFVLCGMGWVADK